MVWTGGMPCKAWMKKSNQINKKTTFLAVLFTHTFLWVSADQTNKKTTFLAVITPFYGLQYGMDGWDAVRTLVGKQLIKHSKRRLFSQFLHLPSLQAAV
jgi:hypothetical protein